MIRLIFSSAAQVALPTCFGRFQVNINSFRVSKPFIKLLNKTISGDTDFLLFFCRRRRLGGMKWL